ncbi:signal peptidase I [Leisingera sp. McT4-56]|uniref:signal peptidase I n=1 Tax=Leisingera sp. McT4-56 TaxID=2881255 RepID=UPI001CF875B9|nr:signal peptidase I [Leisingera sp. McT4-56]MCB4455952.1 signal peptidase I [Leisingera sp. McT4-56]
MKLKLPILLAVLQLLPIKAAANECICALCLFGNHHMWRITGEAMAPTLDSGVCAVSRFIDPVKEPPAPGDVIVFKHPTKANTSGVFRVVATEGNTVRITAGKVILNGRELPQVPTVPLIRDIQANPNHRCEDASLIKGGKCPVGRYVETLPNGRSYEVLDLGYGNLDNTRTYTVPPGHLFVLGDHRDHANDSRVPKSDGGIGFVPVENVTGIFDDR